MRIQTIQSYGGRGSQCTTSRQTTKNKERMKALMLHKVLKVSSVLSWVLYHFFYLSKQRNPRIFPPTWFTPTFEDWRLFGKLKKNSKSNLLTYKIMYILTYLWLRFVTNTYSWFLLVICKLTVLELYHFTISEHRNEEKIEHVHFYLLSQTEVKQK